MGRKHDPLRYVIAGNIYACRVERFPGRGGGQECAKEFGVSPQQWSPWENGSRTPNSGRLKQIAEFFGKDVFWMTQEHGSGIKRKYQDFAKKGYACSFGLEIPPSDGRDPEIWALEVGKGLAANIQDFCIQNDVVDPYLIASYTASWLNLWIKEKEKSNGTGTD